MDTDIRTFKYRPEPDQEIVRERVSVVLNRVRHFGEKLQLGGGHLVSLA
jgi:hypothetical protein